MNKSKKSSAVTKAPVKDVTVLESDNLTRDNDAVAVAAYFKAEKRNFESGHELEDWCEAESELTEVQT